GRPSGRSPTRFLWVGCWGVHTIALCRSRAHGAVSSCRACGLPDGLRGALCTLPLCRSACHLLHRCNTRYGWLVRPDPVGTSTLQETPSFAWRTNATLQARRAAGARELGKDKAQCLAACFLILPVENRTCHFDGIRLSTCDHSPWGDHEALVPIS